MKNLWNKLKPDYQLKIRKASRKYDSARRLKYTLMAASGWYDLKLNDIRGLSLIHI